MDESARRALAAGRQVHVAPSPRVGRVTIHRGARLSDAVQVLSEVAEHAPFFVRHPGEPDRTQWYQLLELASDHL